MHFRLVPPKRSTGFVLPLALSTAAVVLLSSLSLQTLAMHGRQRSRQRIATAEHAVAQAAVDKMAAVLVEEWLQPELNELEPPA